MTCQQVNTILKLSVGEMETFESDSSRVGGNLSPSFAAVRDRLIGKYDVGAIPGTDLRTALGFGKEWQRAEGLGRIGYNRLEQIHVVAKPTRDGSGLKKLGIIIAIHSKLVDRIEDIQVELELRSIARIAERD